MCQYQWYLESFVLKSVPSRPQSGCRDCVELYLTSCIRRLIRMSCAHVTLKTFDFFNAFVCIKARRPSMSAQRAPINHFVQQPWFCIYACWSRLYIDLPCICIYILKYRIVEGPFMQISMRLWQMKIKWHSLPCSEYSLYRYLPWDVVQLYYAKHTSSERGNILYNTLPWFWAEGNESETRRFPFKLVYPLCL